MFWQAGEAGWLGAAQWLAAALGAARRLGRAECQSGGVAPGVSLVGVATLALLLMAGSSAAYVRLGGNAEVDLAAQRHAARGLQTNAAGAQHVQIAHAFLLVMMDPSEHPS